MLSWKNHSKDYWSKAPRFMLLGRQGVMGGKWMVWSWEYRGKYTLFISVWTCIGSAGEAKIIFLL